MKQKTSLLFVLSCITLLCLASGCEQEPGTIILTAKATTKSIGSSTNLDNIPVIGGTVNVQTAMINVEKFIIEENSGSDGEFDGENDDGDSDVEAEDITVKGPFSLDISSGFAPISNVSVYPGTFKQVDVTFLVNIDPPFNGNSIIISGEFIPAGGGVPVPFNLQSEFSEEIQCLIAGGGITVTSNSTVTMTVNFDLAKWFELLDFANAQITNGVIEINTLSNLNLLANFENNFENSGEVDEENEEELEEESGHQD